MKVVYRKTTGRSQHRGTVNGFTLLETIVVSLLIGILFAIAAPGGLALLDARRAGIAEEEAFLALRNAQHQAKLHRAPWQASFREMGDFVQWAIHPVGTLPSEANWNTFDAKIRIDPETTLRQSQGVYRVQFNHQGDVNGQLGRLTLSVKSGSRTKRCILVSTLLGKMRRGSNHFKAKDGKYCY